MRLQYIRQRIGIEAKEEGLAANPALGLVAPAVRSPACFFGLPVGSQKPKYLEHFLRAEPT